MAAGVAALALVVGLSAVTGRLPSSAAAQAKTHFDRATKMVDGGDFINARAACEKAIEIKPDYADAHALLGFIQLNQGHAVPAIASMTKAIDLGMPPDELSVIYAFRGLARVSLALNDLALTDFDEAIALDSRNAFAYFGRGAMYATVGKDTQAILDLEKALEFGLDGELRREAEALLEKLEP